MAQIKRIGTDDDANPWINKEIYKHLRALGCTDFLYFNAVFANDAETDAFLKTLDTGLDIVPDAQALPDIDVATDHVVTGSYRTTRADYLANGV